MSKFGKKIKKIKNAALALGPGALLTVWSLAGARRHMPTWSKSSQTYAVGWVWNAADGRPRTTAPERDNAQHSLPGLLILFC
jgi:hypothetical protein